MSSKDPKSEVSVGDVRAKLTFRNTGKTTSLTKKPDGTPSSTHKSSFRGSSSYLINSYNWAESYDPNQTIDREYNVPKMILREFQPQRGFRWEEAVGQLATAATKAVFEKAISKLGIPREITDQVKQLAIKGGAGAYELITLKEYGSGTKSPIEGMSINFVKNLMRGEYLGQYEVPFFSDAYLKADAKDGWSAGGSERIVGDEFSKILSDDFAMNFPMAPLWSKSSEEWVDAGTEFYLINDNNDNLKNNFRFLNSLVSGCFWVQLDFLQQAPNVYDVEVPGRFHSYFTALGVEVNYVGKTRLNSDVTRDLKVI